ncbi:CBS domain-containing protein [Gammaproteobacteria bacterium]
MEAGHLRFLAARARICHYPPGSVLLDPDMGFPQWLTILLDGCVQGTPMPRQEGPHGFQLIAGECFPIGALLSNRSVIHEYRALRETRCCLLAKADFESLLDQSAAFKDFCVRRLANLLDQIQKDIQAQYAERQTLDGSLGHLIPRPPVTCSPETPIREALQQMQQQTLGAMVVVSGQSPVGLFTLRDLLKISLEGCDLARPIATVMRHAWVALPSTAPAFEAVLAMARHPIRHLLVVDDERLIGVISEKDLFQPQRLGVGRIVTAITEAENQEQLVQAADAIRLLAHHLLAQGLVAEPLTQLIATLNDRLTQRILELETLKAGNRLHFCWLSLGSEGRFEQTLKTDQDNGILFQAPPGVEREALRERLLTLAERVNQTLADCGFPLCRGRIMASRREWCLSLEEWKTRFATWIDQGTPQDLLFAAIFFDLRGLWGEVALAEELRQWLMRKIISTPRFLHQMAANALLNSPPLGLVRDFVLSGEGELAHTLDLKMNGATLFVDGARILALRIGSAHTNTPQRLRAAAAAGRLTQDEAETWIQAFLYIQLLRLRQQHRQPDAGNRIDPGQLNGLERRILKESLRQAGKLQSRLSLDYRLR